MTNKEYLTRSLANLGLTDDDVELILIKGGIDADSPVDVSACDRAVYNRMSVVLQATMMNVTEGGYSISWNMEAVKLFYRALCNELGAPDVLSTRPRVRDRSNLW